jgi:pimeloyl-ACP methyl ester carboxylesterase
MMRAHSRDGTPIAFERSGIGPPLVLVDGALCSRSFGPMPKLVPLLEPHFTVYWYDRRGRNDSGATAPYSVAREVEDLEALVNEAGGSAFVYGVSSGAVLALEAAAKGVKIRKLALYEPPLGLDKKQPPTDHVAALSQRIAANRRADAVKYFMRDMVGVPAPFVLAMRFMPMWSKLEAVAHTLPYDAALVGDPSLLGRRAATVSVPTLVMGGAKSPAALRAAVQAVSAAVPGARQRLLAGQTHDVKPQALAPVLVEYFEAA